MSTLHLAMNGLSRSLPTAYHPGPESHSFSPSGKDHSQPNISQSSNPDITTPLNPASSVSLVGFDTVLAVVGVYQAARHNWDRTQQGDPLLRQALVEAAGLIEALVRHYHYLDEHSRQLLNFFLVVWSWTDVEVVVPPTSEITQLHN